MLGVHFFSCFSMIPDSFLQFYGAELSRFRQKGLYRSLREVEGPIGPTIRIDGRTLIQFSSNDYLGLATHPQMTGEASAALKRLGAGMGASRLISGNQQIHARLEKELALFKETEAALIFSSGYLTHIGTIPALVGEGDWIFSDALNHASLVDACRLSPARVEIYPHLQLDFIESRLKKRPPRPGTRILIATDGIFSMDGDLAPLPEMMELSEKFGALVLIDDAHATGVLGPRGEGSAGYWQLDPGGLLTMGTFSKSLGSLGGFITGSGLIVEYLRNRARTLFYSTALPPSVCAAARCALRLLVEEPRRLQSLRAHIAYFQEGLKRIGIVPSVHPVPIFPIIVGSEETALRLSQALWDRGLYIPAIRPPTVPPKQCRLRISLMATHTRDQLDELLSALRELL
jgi:8-amino-7-oxononanoate synthase